MLHCYLGTVYRRVNFIPNCYRKAGPFNVILNMAAIWLRVSNQLLMLRHNNNIYCNNILIN